MTERVYTVEGAIAAPATPITLAEAGLRERSDLQEWILAHPEILGADVLVVTFEFDRWQAHGGERERDRLDVLGLDSDGRLVVAELKRDRAPDTVEMQAIKYAAMVSRFTEEALVEQYARMLARSEPSADEEVARERLLAHAGDLDPEQLRRPRIVLVAGSFPPVVTAAAVWLTEMGLDLTLQQVQAYRVFGERVIVTVSQLFPVADVEDFTIAPQRAGARAAEEVRRSGRDRSTVVRLVASKVIPDGTPLFLRPTDLTPETQAEFDAWVAADPTRARAIWHNDRRKPLEWQADGGRYRPTEIARRALTEATGVERSVRGPAWWVLEDGRDLPTVAGATGRSRFDWGPLHELLATLPSGSWTTYGDLAEVVGTAAQPLGQHIMNCPDCPNAWRVLGTGGLPRPGFAWSDPGDHRTQQQALEQEGLGFIDGKAETSRHLGADELGLIE